MSVNIMIEAVMKHDINTLIKLLGEGMDPNETDRDGRTALIHSVIDGDISMISLMLNDGNTNINLQDRLGYTALHYAAQDYSEDICNILLEHGAEVDLQDIHGNTPLWKAIFNSKGRPEVIQLLLKYGADKHKKNKSDKSPYDLANTIANYNVSTFLE